MAITPTIARILVEAMSLLPARHHILYINGDKVHTTQRSVHPMEQEYKKKTARYVRVYTPSARQCFVLQRNDTCDVLGALECVLIVRVKQYRVVRTVSLNTQL